MGRGRFTEEEMDRLLQNPYVTDVNRTSISYSREFKQLFMGEYTAGRMPELCDPSLRDSRDQPESVLPEQAAKRPGRAAYDR